MIRFRDFPTGNYANATTCDDNNWAIGADDNGVSEFKIVYGGGANSTRITSIQETSQTGTTVMGFQSDLQVRTTGFKVTETAELAGTSAVGGTSRNAHYDATLAEELIWFMDILPTEMVQVETLTKLEWFYR